MDGELTKFQIDLLAVLAETPGRGSVALDVLEAQYEREFDALDVDEDVHVPHGRLYQNLDALRDRGLVEKEENGVSDRAHKYELTTTGLRFIREYTASIYGRIDNPDAEARVLESRRRR